MQTMTLQERQLLLKDLSARLPYGVQCEVGGLRFGPYTFGAAPSDIEDLMEGRVFKPYLRPMPSMTDAEWLAYCDASLEDDKTWVNAGKGRRFISIQHKEDFLHSHHFDYRGLIPMGLAIEAPEGMYNED